MLEMVTYSICLFKIHNTPLHAEGWKQSCSEVADLILFNLKFFKHIDYGIYISPSNLCLTVAFLYLPNSKSTEYDLGTATLNTFRETL